MEYHDIGENIRKFRNRLNLTQDELADRVGITWEMISRYERGESSPMNKLDKLAHALGINITDLLNDKIKDTCEIPLFTEIPTNHIFSRENTTLYYNCPTWLVNIDPAVFIVDTMIVDSTDSLSKEKGYLFISPNVDLSLSDYVLVLESNTLKVCKYKCNGIEPIGKVMMQEIILH